MVTSDETRRAFLKKTAVGAIAAGGVWVAPTVLSLDAASAVGTCPSGSLTFPWSSGGEGTRHTAVTNPVVGTVGGIDVRIISTAVSATGVASAGLIVDNFSTRGTPQNAACPPTLNCGSAATTNYPRGNSTSFYSLLMNNTTACNCTSTGTLGRFVEVVFGFFNTGTNTAHAVRNLAFSLYDIDSAGSYRDQVHVFINGSATEATLGAGQNAIATLPGATPTVAGTRRPRRSSAPSTAPRPPPTATTATSTCSSLAALSITQVRVRFNDILATAPTTVQWVGIGNLTFCKV